MTEDEIKVLAYVQAGLGGPNSLRCDLRPTFFDLMERGYIREEPTYVLTAQAMLELAHPPKDIMR